MGKIVAVVNQKGGVGKTTTSINLSTCLARGKYSVLLVDMDPQANSTSGVGVDKNEIELSVYDGLVGNVDVLDIILQTEYDYLDVLPSQCHLTGAEVELTSTEKREYKLKSILDKVKKKYDYIIIDCPPSLGLLTLNTLCAADSVLIPLQAEYFALEGISDLVQTMELVKKELNKKIDVEGILVTMCDVRTNLAKQVIEEVKNYFKEKVYKTVIPRNIKLAEAPGFGQPIVFYDIKSIGAEKYLQFTAEFLKRNR